MCKKSNAEREDPSRTMWYAEKAEPMRANFLKLTIELTWTKSKTEKLLPRCTIP
jgi:hypothetical protein